MIVVSPQSSGSLSARLVVSQARTLRKALTAAVLAIVVLIGGCAGAPARPAPAPATAPAPAPSGPRGGAPMDVLSQQVRADALLYAKYGDAERARFGRGLDQIGRLWRAEDGDLAAFAVEHYVADDATRERLLARLEQVLEQLDGHGNEMGRELRRATDVDVGPLLGIDPLLASIDPTAHMVEDLFRSKAAFVVLLNFPLTTLDERGAASKGYSRRQWAEVRLANRFARRVPPEIQQRIGEVGSRADLYIAGYNVWMHHVLGPNGARLFPKGRRLISHWNLRDELKSAYADPDAAAARQRQRTIAQVMERIVTQSLPAGVIDNPRLDWDPETNAVAPAPADTVEADAPPARPAPEGREPDARYQHWLEQFHALRSADPYSPSAPTAIARSFELGREMPETRVVGLLEQVVSSPVVRKVAARIEKRLGRPLEPHDLWYAGFKPRNKYSEADLDARTRQRYPDAQAFARDIPRILEALGFPAERARFVAERIAVDPARGAGHAMPALRRGDQPRLRTRVGKEGMDYKGYNIAVHELGHNVEQVFSLYSVDRTLLQGVPNNAFTEAMAFVFQARDLELLGLSKRDAESERLRVLEDFWATWEIAGVALLDVAVWHWLYEHPDATPAALREAVVRLARELWNKHYAPVLGGKDSTLLAIYSHLIAYPLYMPDYPLGHLIAFQIEEHLSRKPSIGPEIERMTSHGSVMPDRWMEHATGAPVSAEPLLRAAERAADAI